MALPSIFSLDGFFLLGDVFSTILMGFGIRLESPEHPTRRERLGGRLVMIAVVAETLFTIALFAHDAAVSNEQQARIADLTSRLAARTLSATDSSIISAAVEKYSGTSFELITYKSDREAEDITDEISWTLGHAGWQEYPPPTPGAIVGVIAGVVIDANTDADPVTVAAGAELAKQLNRKHIATVFRRSMTGEKANRLVIFVGIKP
jgi:hypothetical protein